MGSEARRTALAGAAGWAIAMCPVPADAFVKACHQGITTEALDGARWPKGALSPPLTHQYESLIVDLSIDVDPSVRNLWALSALIGNQYNDPGPYDLKDPVALSQYAADPAGQREHCLRGPDDDGPEGDGKALAACRAYILEELAAAIGSADAPDLESDETVTLFLVFSGKTKIPLSKFGFHLGRATHALQDVFTHTFRSPGELHVRSVLNWVDWLKGTGGYVPERDGFQHLAALDQCDAATEGGLDRRAGAKQATMELLAAIGADEEGRAGRLARAGVVVDRWLALDAGCTFANDYCDAPERKQQQFLGCGVAPRQNRSDNSEAIMAVMALATMTMWRRRSRRGLTAALLVAGLALGGAGAAQAQDQPPPPPSDAAQAEAVKAEAVKTENAEVKKDAKPAAQAERGEHPERGEIKGGVIAKATPQEQRTLEAHPLGFVFKAGGAIDNASYDVGVGFRFDISHAFTLGLDAEYNPWFSLETMRTTKGTTNVYGVGIWRIDVKDYLELRITGAVGASVLMFDTFAAKSGTVGPYFAISPLGVAFRMSGHFRLIIDPAEIIVSIPQATGIPLAYRQHRFSLALQANF